MVSGRSLLKVGWMVPSLQATWGRRLTVHAAKGLPERSSFGFQISISASRATDTKSARPLHARGEAATLMSNSNRKARRTAEEAQAVSATSIRGTLTFFPDDLALSILRHAGAKAALRVACTCKSFHALTMGEGGGLWQALGDCLLHDNPWLQLDGAVRCSAQNYLRLAHATESMKFAKEQFSPTVLPGDCCAAPRQPEHHWMSVSPDGLSASVGSVEDPDLGRHGHAEIRIPPSLLPLELTVSMPDPGPVAHGVYLRRGVISCDIDAIGQPGDWNFSGTAVEGDYTLTFPVQAVPSCATDCVVRPVGGGVASSSLSSSSSSSSASSSSASSAATSSSASASSSAAASSSSSSSSADAVQFYSCGCHYTTPGAVTHRVAKWSAFSSAHANALTLTASNTSTRRGNILCGACPGCAPCVSVYLYRAATRVKISSVKLLAIAPSGQSTRVTRSVTAMMGKAGKGSAA